MIIIFLKLIQILFAILNPYEYYEIRSEILFYLICEIALFSIIILFVKKNYTIKNNYELRPVYEILAKFYIIPAVLFLFLMLYIKFKFNLSFQGLRDYFYFSDGIINFKKINFFVFIYHAFGFFLLINYIIERNHKMFTYISISLLMFDAAQGGRMYFYYIFMLYVIFLFTNLNINIKFKKKNVIKYYLLTIILLITFSIIVFSRVDAGKFLETLYIYFIGPIFLFDVAINKEDVINLPDLRFGVSFMSVDWTLIGIVKTLGFEIETLNTLLDPILKTGYFFSNNVGMNAHFTSAFYTYLDFGFFGFLYFPLIIYILTFIKTRFIFFILILLLFSSMISIREHFINSPIFILAVILSITGIKKCQKNYQL